MSREVRRLLASGVPVAGSAHKLLGCASLQLLQAQADLDSMQLPDAPVRDAARVMAAAAGMVSGSAGDFGRLVAALAPELPSLGAARATVARFAQDVAGGRLRGLLAPSRADITATKIVIEGVDMGTMYSRDVLAALFHPLLEADLSNFYVAPLEVHVNAADLGSARVLGDPATYPWWRRLHAHVAQSAQMVALCAAMRDGAADAAAVAAGAAAPPPPLPASPLVVACFDDATTVATTASSSQHPITLTVLNFALGARRTHAASALWALLPNWYNAEEAGTFAHKQFARRANLAYHACWDVLIAEIAALRDGFLWEIAHNVVVPLALRFMGIFSDYPQMQTYFSCKNSAAALQPCRICTVPRWLKLRSMNFPAKTATGPGGGGMPLSGRAAVSALAGAIPTAASLKAGKAMGVNAIGRVPAAFTLVAAGVGVGESALDFGPLELLHVLPGGILPKVVSTDKD